MSPLFSCPQIFTSKGDMGVFRNNKREITAPKGFNFQTDKRNQQNPPIDLFNKLSLTSEVQTSEGPQLKLSQPCTLEKGSKENRWDPLEHQIINGLRGKLSTTGDRAWWRGDRD
ncbi:hypothetical protein RJ641_001145 [Dillenia turbinata]|uniref:Uncharacterized protein n=1 Tax=Dillenia turbinata TaxID=194707 RepID=A0AAN8ZS55_9MAGN